MIARAVDAITPTKDLYYGASLKVTYQELSAGVGHPWERRNCALLSSFLLN